MSIASENSETAILSRVLDPESEPMTPEAAHYFLSAKFPQEDADRMNALADKSRQGTLTENRASHSGKLLPSWRLAGNPAIQSQDESQKTQHRRLSHHG